MKTTEVKKVIANKREFKPKKIEKPLFEFEGEKYKSLDEVLSAISDYGLLEEVIYVEFEDKTVINFATTKLPYCCAISEIGDMTYIPFPGDVHFFDELAIMTQGHTFMMNLNGKYDCIELSKTLRKCVNWTLVKTFVNSNSGNTIEMWISRNA